MSLSSISGFAHAPVSKSVLVLSAGATIIGLTVKRPPSSSLRFLSRVALFRSPGELLFGSFLLYSFRLLERQTGSNKFSGYALSVTALSLGLQAALVWFLPPIGPLPTGPYGLIFASFVHFFLNIPSQAHFHLLGLRMSDKTFIYLAGLQLLFVGGAPSIVAGTAGLLAGLLHRLNFLGIRKFKFPTFISQPIARLFGTVIAPSGPRVATQMGGPPTPHNRHRPPPPHPMAGVERGGGSQRAGEPGLVRRPAPGRGGGDVVVNEEAVQQLEAMGFSHGAASRALQATHNDVQAAIALLV